MARESWRKTILEAVADEGEVSADALHEGAEGEDDLQEAVDAAETLVAEGLLIEAVAGVYMRNPTGPWGDDVPEA